LQDNHGSEDAEHLEGAPTEAYRVFAVRTNVRDRGQVQLWDELDYSVQVYVTTDRDRGLDELAHLYDDRAGIEPLIGALKNDFGIGTVSTCALRERSGVLPHASRRQPAATDGSPRRRGAAVSGRRAGSGRPASASRHVSCARVVWRAPKAPPCSTPAARLTAAPPSSRFGGKGKLRLRFDVSMPNRSSGARIELRARISSLTSRGRAKSTFKQVYALISGVASADGRGRSIGDRRGLRVKAQSLGIVPILGAPREGALDRRNLAPARIEVLRRSW